MLVLNPYDGQDSSVYRKRIRKALNFKSNNKIGQELMQYTQPLTCSSIFARPASLLAVIRVPATMPFGVVYWGLSVHYISG